MSVCLLAAYPAEAGGKTYLAEYGGNDANAAAAVASAGGTVTSQLPEIGVIVAESENPDFAATLAAQPGFSSVTEDQMVQWVPGPDATGDVESFSAEDPGAAASPFSAFFLARQWNIFKTKTNLAWSVTQGSPSVKVAILDTGICSHHQDLAGRVDAAESASFVTSECAPTVFPPCIGCPAWEDRHFHGTHVGGTISSNNLGTASIAPNVRLRAVKVLNCTGSGTFGAVINGIIYAANTGNDVINMSLGAYFPKDLFPGIGRLIGALNKAVNYAHSQGVLVVSAAGNSAVDLDHDKNFTAVPCQSGSGLCVGATTSSDALASFSNHGLSGPQITAPGGGNPANLALPFPDRAFVLAPCSRHTVNIPICGASPTQFYLFVRGTSMATPHVAGAAALVGSLNPGASPAQLQSAVLQGADDLGKKGADNIYSKGRLNTLNAVQ